MKYDQDNIEQLFRLIGSLPNQDYGHSTYCDFIRTTNSVWPNLLINLNTSEHQISVVMEQMENDVETGAIPNLLMLNPTHNNTQIINQLKNRDYKSSVWTAMTHNLQLASSPNEIANFHIKLIQSKTDLRKWLAIVESELMGNHSLNADIFDALLDNVNCYFFLGFENNLPVATSFLFVNKKTVGIYLVSTLKSHRKKGYGKAITLQCLLKAKELSCEQAHIQATESGKSVYDSLGFISQGDINVFRIKG